jgi:hypothetical protein
MQLVEGPVEALILPNFEEALAAFEAVKTVMGENHPLVAIDSRHTGIDGSLFKELSRPGEQVPREFESDDAKDIMRSLEEIGSDASDSPYRLTARHMLDTLLTDETVPKPRTEPEPIPEAVAPASVAVPAPSEHHAAAQPIGQRAPASLGGHVMRGHVELVGFGELLAAMRSVEEFGGPGKADTLAELYAHLEFVDPFAAESLLFWEDRAETIHRSLVKARARGTESHDLSAAHLLSGNPGEDRQPDDISSEAPLVAAA